MALTLAQAYPDLTQAERDAICDAIRALAVANLGHDPNADNQYSVETAVHGPCTIAAEFLEGGEKMIIKTWF